MKTKQEIEEILKKISDPEIPVLSIVDLGIIRDVIPDGNQVQVNITPTYSGCPAMNMIATQIRMELLSNGFEKVIIQEELYPAWTTDWITEEGKLRLKKYGISPPQKILKENNEPLVICPQCESVNTELVSEFGSTACKSLYKCLDCFEPFDYFKCH